MPTMEDGRGGAHLFLQKVAFPASLGRTMPFALGLTGSVGSISKGVGTAPLSLFLSHTFQKLVVAGCEDTPRPPSHTPLVLHALFPPQPSSGAGPAGTEAL